MTHYFIDDFEAGLKNWRLTDDTGRQMAWDTSMEDANAFLSAGEPLYWIMLENKTWNDFIFKVRFKIVSGSMRADYRLAKGGASGYIVSVNESQVILMKVPGIVLGDIGRVNLTKTWHTLEIRGYGDTFNVYIDDELLIKAKDTNSPNLSGGIAFENVRGTGTEFLIDDVEIKIIAEKDVTYP